jgi:threonyl-tRNA synthetase
MLTRIYGTVFPTQKELDDYLLQQEEAKKRDHRKLGKELGLFTINNEVGQGITIWLPNGSIIRREIENYMVAEQTKLGYKHVYSPHIGKKSLWEKSGHWDLYRDKMYSPMDVDGVEYLVKPMTCPMHIQSYEFTPKSYRDLPYRIAEIGSVYRYEQSGELAGLLRVRAFTQDDAHIFCTPEQTVDEFLSVFAFTQKLYKMFGFTDYRVRLGIRSKKGKYLGNDDLWEKAQEKIIAALDKSNVAYTISEGDAAFYGPKADFMIKDALGREWQCGTVQVDFMLPERFGLKYIDQNGTEQTPVMIHRAPLGSLERFPAWLAPVQMMLIPIAERHVEAAKKMAETLRIAGVRVEIDEKSEPMGAKIRNATLQKVPFMGIIGDKEVTESSLSVRTRKGENLKMESLENFLSLLHKEIEHTV